MSVGERSVGEMSIGEMSVGEMSWILFNVGAIGARHRRVPLIPRPPSVIFLFFYFLNPPISLGFFKQLLHPNSLKVIVPHIWLHQAVQVGMLTLPVVILFYIATFTTCP